MKRVIFFSLITVIAVSLYAQEQIPEYHFASGRWGFIDERLYQNDAKAPLAKVNFLVPQQGPMVYEFNVRYEGGAEDGQGGFGLHVFADTSHNSASWGSGNSYLLWLNYDEKPRGKSVPAGLSAQVYRSYTNSRMELVQSISLSDYTDLLTTENLAAPIPFKIEINGETGEFRIYDPTDEGVYYYFKVNQRDIPLKGNWVSLRTNGLKASFALGLGL
jgi:hypothetical protein